MRILIILLALSAAFDAVAQTLADIDAKAGKLMAEPNRHEYEYELPQWREAAARTLQFAEIDSIAAFKPSYLKKLTTGEATIFYFVERSLTDARLHWIARVGDRAMFFENQINSTATSLHFTATTDETLTGFEVTDSLLNKQMLYIPDVALMFDFETIADVKQSDEAKKSSLESIQSKLDILLKTRDALSVSLNALPRLFSVSNSAGTVRLLTYMVAYGDFSCRFAGLLVSRKQNGKIDITRLKDQSTEIRSPERVKLSPTKWYGAVYTELIEIEVDNQTYYTLLGYRGNDGLVKTRILEVLAIQGNKVTFGAPLFVHEKITYSRRVFRYSADASMMIRFDARRKMIVFDHLAPSSNTFTGEARFYGPDFSYDAYERTKRGWVFKDDVDLRND